MVQMTCAWSRYDVLAQLFQAYVEALKLLKNGITLSSSGATP